MDFDSLPDDGAAQAQTPAGAPQDPTQAPQQAGSVPPSGTPSFDSMQDDTEKFNAPGQTLKAGLEGALRGTVGPLAPIIEKQAGVKSEDILGREAAHPIAHGVGEGAGLVGGMLTGTGEAAVLGKAGELAAGMAGLGDAAKGASYAYRVGSEAVKQAAEMAVLSGSDETAKTILQDPNQTASSAIANMGLSAALGGVTGGAMAGIVSPLWKASGLGEKLGAALDAAHTHFNGGVADIPADIMKASENLGVEIPAEIKGANTSSIMRDRYNTVKKAGNVDISDLEDQFHENINNKVAESIGIDPKAVAVSSDHEEGKAIQEAFQKEYEQKYAPFEAKYKAQNEEAAKIDLPDEDKLNTYNHLLGKGISDVGTDAPEYQLFHNWGNRMLAQDTVGGVDRLITQIGSDMKKAYRSGDDTTRLALKSIQDTFKEMQENQITKQAAALDAVGAPGASSAGRDMLRERANLRGQYRSFADMSQTLADGLGVGNFQGAGRLEGKITDKLTPEDAAKKFSFSGDVDFMKFLKQHFPETYETTRQSELRKLVKPAITSAKGGDQVNIGRLDSIIKRTQAGRSEYLNEVMPAKGIQAVQDAQTLHRAIPNPKDSGTTSGIMKALSNLPASAMGMIGLATGHNPVLGGVVGHLGGMLTRNTPDAINLGLLRFVGSDVPVSSGGFKAMVDFLHNTYKGQNLLSKGTQAIFKAGAQVIPTNLIPTATERMKLDKIVSSFSDDPSKFINGQNSADLGHYLPEHQEALSQQMMGAVGYLNHLKPQPYKPSPLDKAIPPTQAQTARYNRALDIAQQPLMVMQHIKDGTLQESDIVDLKSLYPEMYNTMAQRVSNQMTNKHSDEEIIPYKTRMGISLFLGQPVDSTMTPDSIMAAQMTKKTMPQSPQAQGGKPKGSPKALGKSNSMYLTQAQSAEKDRTGRSQD